MKQINRMIAKVEIAVGVTLMTAIVLLVFISAATRTFRYPIVWSVDFAQLLFVWISMIGADIALKYKAHMGVDLLVRKLPAGLQHGITLLTYLLMTGFIGFVIYWGMTLCIENALRQYQTLQISYSYSTAAVPIVGALMLLTALEHIIDLFRDWNKPIVIDELQGCAVTRGEE